jgi:hypothetical protein
MYAVAVVYKWKTVQYRGVTSRLCSSATVKQTVVVVVVVVVAVATNV